jgi:hypothetical protein
LKDSKEMTISGEKKTLKEGSQPTIYNFFHPVQINNWCNKQINSICFIFFFWWNHGRGTLVVKCCSSQETFTRHVENVIKFT